MDDFDPIGITTEWNTATAPSALISETANQTSTSMCSGITASSSKMDTEYRHFYQTAQFLTGLILYPIICFVGILGNLLTLVVLNQPKMVTSTNVFLSALAVADLTKLLNDTLYFIVSILLRTDRTAGNQMMGYMYPFSHYIFNQSVCVASWLTVCIGIERYMYVCQFAQAKKVCTISRARVISTAVFITMSVMAIPSGLKYVKTTELDPVTNQTMFKISLSNLGKNYCFMGMYTWIINLLRSVIPLCVLVVLNTCIILSLWKHTMKGKVSRRNRVTIMLIIVIVVFVVCITPDAVMSTVFGFGYVEGSFLVKGVRECTDTLLAANSAVNFTIYCVCSQGFRDTFHELFCQKRLLPVIRLPQSNRNSQRPLLFQNGTAPPLAEQNKPVLNDETRDIQNHDSVLYHQIENVDNSTHHAASHQIKIPISMEPMHNVMEQDESGDYTLLQEEPVDMITIEDTTKTLFEEVMHELQQTRLIDKDVHQNTGDCLDSDTQLLQYSHGVEQANASGCNYEVDEETHMVS